MRIELKNNNSLKYVNALKEKDFTSENFSTIIDNIVTKFEKDCEDGCTKIIKNFITPLYMVEYQNSFKKFKKDLNSNLIHYISKNMLVEYSEKDKKKLIKIIKVSLKNVYRCCKINFNYMCSEEKVIIEEIIRLLGFEFKKVKYTDDELIIVLGKLKYYENIVDYDEFIENLL